MPLPRFFKNAAHFVYVRFVVIFVGVAVRVDGFIDKKFRVEKLRIQFFPDDDELGFRYGDGAVYRIGTDARLFPLIRIASRNRTADFQRFPISFRQKRERYQIVRIDKSFCKALQPDKDLHDVFSLQAAEHTPARRHRIAVFFGSGGDKHPLF